jgi:hypothetical protein
MTPLPKTIEASIHAPIETGSLSQFDEARGVEVVPKWPIRRGFLRPAR